MGQFLTKIRKVSELLVSLDTAHDGTNGKRKERTNLPKKHSKKTTNISAKNLAMENGNVGKGIG